MSFSMPLDPRAGVLYKTVVETREYLVDDISLMPADIANVLQPQQLVDLVTWLETLRATR